MIINFHKIFGSFDTESAHLRKIRCWLEKSDRFCLIKTKCGTGNEIVSLEEMT